VGLVGLDVADVDLVIGPGPHQPRNAHASSRAHTTMAPATMA
jgi:hypothetical protein